MAETEQMAETDHTQQSEPDCWRSSRSSETLRWQLPPQKFLTKKKKSWRGGGYYCHLNITALSTRPEPWTEELPGESYFSSCSWGWLTSTSQVCPFKTRTNFGEFQSGSPSLANGPPDLDKERRRVQQVRADFCQCHPVSKTWDVDWRGPTRQPREDERFGTLPEKITQGRLVAWNVKMFRDLSLCKLKIRVFVNS